MIRRFQVGQPAADERSVRRPPPHLFFIDLEFDKYKFLFRNQLIRKDARRACVFTLTHKSLVVLKGVFVAMHHNVLDKRFTSFSFISRIIRHRRKKRLELL